MIEAGIQGLDLEPPAAASQAAVPTVPTREALRNGQVKIRTLEKGDETNYPCPGDYVIVDYKVWTISSSDIGEEVDLVDSSYNIDETESRPFKFTVGEGKV